MPSLRAAFAATVLFVLKMKKTQSIEAFRTTQIRSGEHDGAQTPPVAPFRLRCRETAAPQSQSVAAKSP